MSAMFTLSGTQEWHFLSVIPIVHIFGLDSLAQLSPYMECYGGQW